MNKLTLKDWLRYFVALASLAGYLYGFFALSGWLVAHMPSLPGTFDSYDSAYYAGGQIIVMATWGVGIPWLAWKLLIGRPADQVKRQ